MIDFSQYILNWYGQQKDDNNLHLWDSWRWRCLSIGEWVRRSWKRWWLGINESGGNMFSENECER